MADTLVEFGDAVRAVRKAKKLNQSALAKQAGLNQPQLSQIEAGKSDIRYTTLVELARALELELMLVPRRSVPAVSSVIRGATKGDMSTPLRAYRLQEDS